MDENWLTLAVIGQPHGVSGRVKIRSFTDPVDDFITHPGLTYENGAPLKLTITGHAQGMAIAEIEGITSRTQAEPLRGRKLGVPRESLPPLADRDQFYAADLIGMRVYDLQGQPFGEVVNVANYGASDLLDIRRANGLAELYAFTHATFPEIDHAARRITIDPPLVIGSRAEERAPT